MANYTKLVDYAAKDLLLTLDPAKAVKGTEVGAEFDAIATMSGEKVNFAGAETITGAKTMTGANVITVATPTASTHAASVGQEQNSTTRYLTIAGTANALTGTLTPATTAYVAGQKFHLIAGLANTGAATIAVSGLTAKAIVKGGTTALEANDIKAANAYILIYDGVSFQLSGGAGGALGTPSSGALDNCTSNTEAVDNNSTQVATTGFVVAQASSATPLPDGTAAVGTSLRYARGDHVHAGIALQTAVATTSGTSIDFTGIPAGVKRITISFIGVSQNTAAQMLWVQLGDAGGIEATGYLGSGARLSAAGVTNLTTAFQPGNAAELSAASVVHGNVVLTLEKASTFTWSMIGMIGYSDAAQMGIGAGSKSLSAELDRVRITTNSGTATFDAGEINISWEF